MSDLPRIFRFINRTSLVAQIVVGLLAGALLALFLPGAAKSVALLGTCSCKPSRRLRRFWCSCW